MPFSAVPDFLFIDGILLAYRLGQIRYEEQKMALVAAARAATDAISFLSALENFGVGRQTQLHRFLGEYLSAPASYRARYPRVLGLRAEGEEAEPFLDNVYALSLPEAVLMPKQRQLFIDTYWWFVHNHQPEFFDIKKGRCIGAYASEPRDNASALARFEDYLARLVNHRTQTVRRRFEDFPADIVVAILKRAFL